MMNLSRASIIIGCFWFISLLPFVSLSILPNPFELPKFLLFVIGVQLLLMLFLWTKKKEKKIFLFSRLSILIYFFLGVMFITDMIGLDPRISLLGSEYRHQGFLTLLSGVLLYTIFRSLMVDNDQKRILNIFALLLLGSSLLLCFVALWQWIQLTILLQHIPSYQGRIVGTLGNPNILGGYLLMILPFVIISRLYYSWFLSVKLFVAFLIIITIFLTGSRGALAGLFGMGVFFCYMKSKHVWQRIAIIGVFILLSLFFFVLIPQQRASIWDNRTVIWSYGAQAFFRSPLIGYGQENFELVFPRERRMKVDNAHNIFLEAAISSGIIGLMLFIAIIFTAFSKAPTVIRFSLLAFLIVGQFNPLGISQIALFWGLLGLIKD